MKITVEIKDVYGVKRIYPICKDAKRLCLLTGNKTFSEKDIVTIRELGYEVEIKTPEI